MAVLVVVVVLLLLLVVLLSWCSSRLTFGFVSSAMADGVRK
jgi:hypothetical protein